MVNRVDPKLVASAKAVMGGDMGEIDILETRLFDVAQDAAEHFIAAMIAHPETGKMNQVEALTGCAFALGIGIRGNIDATGSDAEEAFWTLALAMIRRGMDA